ncbi:UV-damage endonuclease [Hirsutella minnesotensis 3608]|uniref:UV-damage endonuclease n=1 Tax=Hirsutella minnesotensis 3608 TaxID=1043627 RepID=A0A0F7ZTZ0_9HYPO|nr:UV-damage endonuclease [Hirsutella minnesotensis 3608]
MPPKRKRTDPQPSPPPPEALRRSSRRSKGSGDKPYDPAKEAGDAFKPNPRPAVERARQDLSEMEQRLLTESRRQRLAVESSDFAVKADGRPSEKSMRKGPKKTTPTDETNAATKQTNGARDADGDEGPDSIDAAMDDVSPERGARRPPPVNSEKLPLPWKGRLGYACLNTYLRAANPPVFCSRTCRLSSIIDHRHPLQDPSQPEHPTKNRPDKTKPADIKRGVAYVQEIGRTNAADIVKMLRWNDKYGIKFMRLSSEMFPFASHKEHGYKLAPFAASVLAEAGKVAAELGHRLTTHPGQFTQIGSPRPEVVEAAVRDLEYHNELLSLLKLPEQQDRDAVMILHMGGTYGDKEATLGRFRKNYANLSNGVRRRLVLENDDVAWSVHDLLPICEELNIPLVLDFHHHNIFFDSGIREGTQDVMSLFPRIEATWTRKRITQKMHYSEPTAPAVTPRDRRKHSARVRTLPPCPSSMDLMIEAKDKEQAVFELMRTFKLPGWDTFNNIVPHERDDEPRKAILKKRKKPKKTKKKDGDLVEPEIEIEVPERHVSPDSFGMGGPESRVYWPEGMEEWLRPKKREMKKNKGDKKEDGVQDGRDNGSVNDDGGVKEDGVDEE